MKTYRELIVWQKSIKLVVGIYRTTALFPKEETYGLMSQMRRAVVAIPSNIAEGYSRRHTKEFAQFVKGAFASGAELETQIIVAKELRFLSVDKFTEVDGLLTEVMRMLNKLDSSLTNKS